MTSYIIFLKILCDKEIITFAVHQYTALFWCVYIHCGKITKRYKLNKTLISG